jgi:hypothetical protein
MRPNPAAAPRARARLWGLLGWIACEGLLNGWASGVGGQVPRSWDWVFDLGQAVLVYQWLCEDARAQGVQRTLGLTGLVIVAALPGVPIYLWRSRLPGARLAAMGRLLGFIALACACYVLAGAPLAYWLGGA